MRIGVCALQELRVHTVFTVITQKKYKMAIYILYLHSHFAPIPDCTQCDSRERTCASWTEGCESEFHPALPLFHFLAVSLGKILDLCYPLIPYL